LLFSLAIQVSLAGAPRPNPHLEKAKSLYRKLQYVDVVKRLERALKVKRNTKGQLCEIYSLMGTVHVVLGKEKAARRAFKQLLTIDPGYSLDPGISPKILGLFQRVKRELAPPATFRTKPRVYTRPGEYPRVQVELADPGKTVEQVDLWCRDPKGKFRRKTMKSHSKGRYSGYLPVKAEEYPGGFRLAYFIQAKGSQGKILAGQGSQAKPFIFTIPATPPPVEKPVAVSSPWYKKWWIWTAVGVVVVGVSVGVGVAASDSTDVPVGSLGELKLD
jgi:hypothetical protein